MGRKRYSPAEASIPHRLEGKSRNNHQRWQKSDFWSWRHCADGGRLRQRPPFTRQGRGRIHLGYHTDKITRFLQTPRSTALTHNKLGSAQRRFAVRFIFHGAVLLPSYSPHLMQASAASQQLARLS